jgi:hypothetical protein
MSATVPAPTAWTEAAAPPIRMRKTMSILMLTLMAPMAEKIAKNVKETR